MCLTNKKCPVNEQGNPDQTKRSCSNSSASQRARILKNFEAYPQLSTIVACQQYKILHSCERVLELRKKGHLIDTYWISEADSNSLLHRVDLYMSYRGLDNGGYHANEK